MKKDKSRGSADDLDIASRRDSGSVSESEHGDDNQAPVEVAPDNPQAEDRSPASRPVLPACGFAADLLKQSVTGSSGEGSQLASPQIPGLDADAIDPAAPDRVFDFADQIALGSQQQKETAQPVRLATFVSFELAHERFAIPVDPVRQVVRVSAITRVPHAPRPIRGVTNLRGRVIPVIDLRLRIGLPEGTIDRATRVISVASKGRLIGLLVDAVHQVMHLDLNRVQPPPEDVMTLQSDYIEGVYGEGRDLLMLLDIDRALTIKDAA